jgi:hypothetical protein
VIELSLSRAAPSGECVDREFNRRGPTHLQGVSQRTARNELVRDWLGIPQSCHMMQRRPNNADTVKRV